MLYGHRKDVEGFARSLEEFDAMLGPFLEALRPDGLAADHRRSRLRSRPGESDHGSLPRIRPNSRLQSKHAQGGVNLGTSRNASRHGPNRRRKFRREDPPRHQLPECALSLADRICNGSGTGRYAKDGAHQDFNAAPWRLGRQTSPRIRSMRTLPSRSVACEAFCA